MDEVPLSTIRQHSPIIRMLTTLDLILITLVATLLTWYVKFLWGRRKLYKYSSKLPGPFAFPFVGSAWKFIGNTHEIHDGLMKMYEEYPGVFRFWLGPKLLYGMSDPKYYEILLPKHLKKEYMYRHAVPGLGQGLFTAPVDVWKKHRKIIMPTFNQNILNRFVEIFSTQSEVLVEQLKKFVGTGEFDVFKAVSKCTVDTICQTAMGVNVNAQTSDSHLSACMDRVMEIIVLRLFIWWYQVDAIFNLTPTSKQFWKDINEVHQNTDAVIGKRKAMFEEEKKENIDTSQVLLKDSKRKVFLDYLIEISNNGNKFTETELRDEVNTFIVAGSDTTASANSFAFIMLGLHKDLQEKVYEEIIEVVGPNRVVEQEDLPRLTYMERFIKETLRLFPVAPFISRDVDEDVDLGEYMVPEGTTILFSILRTHTNKMYWPDPYKFDPDRFLPEEVAKRHPCAYLPFSYGPRNCPGMRYGMMAMKTLLATVLRKFKVSTSYKNVQDIKLKTSMILRPEDGYKVSLELR